MGGHRRRRSGEGTEWSGALIRRHLGLLIALGLLRCAVLAAGDETFVFRYGNAQNNSDPRSVSMVFFEQELERRTGGRIEVENYFGGILGTEREMADAVAMGALQGTRGGMFEDASNKFNIVLLPFLVESWDQAICLVRSPWMRRVAAEGRARGLHIPAVGISQGFRAHGSTKRAIRELADTFEGLYPEGDCSVHASGGRSVELSMKDVNLDAARLIELLRAVALPGTLSGRFQVSSFGTVIPEKQRRVLFEAGEVLVQEPLLWPEPAE